jgi:hypothetical protein
MRFRTFLNLRDCLPQNEYCWFYGKKCVWAEFDPIISVLTEEQSESNGTGWTTSPQIAACREARGFVPAGKSDKP